MIINKQDLTNYLHLPIYHHDCEYGLIQAQFHLVKIINDVHRGVGGTTDESGYKQSYDDEYIQGLRKLVQEFNPENDTTDDKKLTARNNVSIEILKRCDAVGYSVVIYGE